VHRVRFGRLNDGDEVVLAVKQVEPELVVELHCHGGRRVVRWVVDRFVSEGCVEAAPGDCDHWSLLGHARTLRTASILLDQYRGAFARAVTDILASIETPAAAESLRQLAALAPVGRHLIEPWKVVIAGAPNVGKSSLVNALAGFQRSVVSETAGTTRDIVTVPVAFDGWPVELADTAGLRRATESLEVEGIALALHFLDAADLVVWLIDATEPAWPELEDRRPDILAVSKSDLATPSFGERDAGLVRISSKTGAGLPELIGEIVRRLTGGTVPQSGAPVPFTSALADAIVAAHSAVASGKVADARRALESCLAPTP
jgi:tRNA modification GTPase